MPCHLRLALRTLYQCDPLPVRLTAWGLFVALSAMFNVPVRVPGLEGVKVTLMVQLAPTATEAPQVLVWTKSVVFVSKMLVMVNVALPVLVSVIVCGELVTPTI